METVVRGRSWHPETGVRGSSSAALPALSTVVLGPAAARLRSTPSAGRPAAPSPAPARSLAQLAHAPPSPCRGGRPAPAAPADSVPRPAGRARGSGGRPERASELARASLCKQHRVCVPGLARAPGGPAWPSGASLLLRFQAFLGVENKPALCSPGCQASEKCVPRPRSWNSLLRPTPGRCEGQVPAPPAPAPAGFPFGSDGRGGSRAGLLPHLQLPSLYSPAHPPTQLQMLGAQGLGLTPSWPLGTRGLQPWGSCCSEGAAWPFGGPSAWLGLAEGQN